MCCAFVGILRCGHHDTVKGGDTDGPCTPSGQCLTPGGDLPQVGVCWKEVEAEGEGPGMDRQQPVSLVLPGHSWSEKGCGSVVNGGRPAASRGLARTSNLLASFLRFNRKARYESHTEKAFGAVLLFAHRS